MRNLLKSALASGRHTIKFGRVNTLRNGGVIASILLPARMLDNFLDLIVELVAFNRPEITRFCNETLGNEAPLNQPSHVFWYDLTHAE